MADHRDYFRQVAAECRRLAEIANKPEIKQRLLNMAAEYQAKADEHSNDRHLRRRNHRPVNLERAAHGALHAASAGSRCGRPKPEIWMVFPFHGRLADTSTVTQKSWFGLRGSPGCATR